jgi:hypothetical protein
MIYMNPGFRDDLSSIFSHRGSSRSKRAQVDASGAATLIAYVALFVVLYILFVPPETRKELLEEGDVTLSGDLISYLVDTQPGKLQYFFDDEFDHFISTFMLRETSFSNVLVEENPFTLQRSWFSDKRKSISFTVPSVRDTTKLLLTFSVDAQPKGNLIILLNGDEVFNKALTQGDVNPITLPLNLVSSSNKLEFVLSPPDLAFWKSNRYEISGARLVGDFVDASTSQNVQKFYLEEIEEDNLGESRLIFSPSCNQNSVGKLTVNLNGANIYSSIPDCDSLNTVHFLPDILQKENLLAFSSSEGEYMMSLINVKTKITDKDYPTYYFEVTDSTFDNLLDETQYVNLSVHMQDDENFKEAYVLVNSVKFFLDTRENVYSKVIPAEVLQIGTNTVQIQPLNSFEVIRLKVGLYD